MFLYKLGSYYVELNMDTFIYRTVNVFPKAINARGFDPAGMLVIFLFYACARGLTILFISI